MKNLKPTMMWCMLNDKGYFDYTSLSHLKRDCIKKFVKNSGHSWGYWKEYYKKRDFGWSLARVLITIEKIG